MRLSWRAPLVAALIMAALLDGCGAGSPAPSPSTARASATRIGPRPTQPAKPTGSATPQASAARSPASLPVAPGAGARPQTRAFPSTNSAAFRHAMTDLWLAVTTGNPRFGLPAFFPEAAYKQVKAIPYPGPDWQDRLWYDFALDVGAAHGLVARGAGLVRVIVPASEAAWVYPGACYNTIGYWHVDGARVVYTEHGEERSFGIASLISWRGAWYVVHFGEVLRPVVTGVVDQPAVGPGTPGPPGGC
ncbi:MAG: hypothetical protein ACRDOH_22105 [Streptosporangiaceae bacterium]